MPRVSVGRAENREITEVEAAEFRGLFFGEGHIDLCRNGRSHTLMPRVRLAVRDDDRAVVEWCRDLFGGCVSIEPRTRSVCWYGTGSERLLRIVDALEGGRIPSKKRREVTLLREAISLRGGRGRHTATETKDRLVAIREEMKALRRYQTPEAA